MITASIKLLPRKSAKKKDGTYPINLRLTINRKSKYFSTGVSCKQADWDTNNQRIKSKVYHSVINNLKLRDAYNKAESIINNFIRFNKPPTFTEFANIYEGDFSKNNFYELGIKYIEKRNLSDESARTYRSQLSKLLQFRSIDFLSLTEVNNLDFIYDYKNYMIEERDNTINTVAKSLGFIKSVINYAISVDIIQTNAFAKIKIKKELGKREYLTGYELTNLNEFYNSSRVSNSERNVLQYYLFSCYTGLRFKDVRDLCWKDITDNDIRNYDTNKIEKWKIIEIKMHKTKLNVDIPLSSMALCILNSLKEGKSSEKVFRVITNQKTNKYLRKTLVKAGINKSTSMSYHSSRHTFATFALLSGMSIKFISKLLGHTDIKTTQIYLQVTKETLVNEVRNLNSFI